MRNSITNTGINVNRLRWDRISVIAFCAAVHVLGALAVIAWVL